MAYTNRKFTWDFDSLKRFYEKYVVKWFNSPVALTSSQKQQARDNIGISAMNTPYNYNGSAMPIVDGSPTPDVQSAIQSIVTTLLGKATAIQLPLPIAGYYNASGSVVSDNTTQYFNSISFDATEAGKYLCIRQDDATNIVSSYVLIRRRGSIIDEKYILNADNRYILFETPIMDGDLLYVSGCNTSYPTVLTLDANSIRGAILELQSIIEEMQEVQKTKETCYVSSVNGNDNNLGTESSPLQTIGKAIKSGASDIVVKAGVYKEQLTAAFADSNASKNISIKAYKGDKVVVRGERSLSYSTTTAEYYPPYGYYFCLPSVASLFASIDKIILPCVGGFDYQYKYTLVSDKYNAHSLIDNRKATALLAKKYPTESTDTSYGEALVRLISMLGEDSAFYFIFGNNVYIRHPQERSNAENMHYFRVSASALIDIFDKESLYLQNIDFLYTGITCTGLNNVHIENCTIRDTNGDGITTINCGTVHLAGCKVINTELDGIKITGNTTQSNVKIENCYTCKTDSGLYSINSNLYVKDSLFEYSNDYLVMLSNTRCQCVNVIAREAEREGFLITKTSNNTSQSYFKDCTVELSNNDYSTGFYLEEFDDYDDDSVIVKCEDCKVFGANTGYSNGEGNNVNNMHLTDCGVSECTTTYGNALVYNTEKIIRIQS